MEGIVTDADRAAAGAESLLIKGGTVMLEAEGPTPREVCFADGLVVLVSGDRIEYVGPAYGCPPGPGVSEYDASGQVVMPGLVNAHTHCAMTLLRGYAQDMTLDDWLKKRIWPAEERMTPDDVYWGAVLACAEMISGGVTSFCDMYFHMGGVAKAVEESGMRAALSQGMAALSDSDRRRTWNAAVDLYSRWNGAGGGRVRVILGPHAPYTCPPDFLEEIASLSADLGAPVTMHLAESRTEVEQCVLRNGKSPVRLAVELGLARNGLIAAHCVHVDADDVRLIASSGAAVAHCPISNLNLACGIAPAAAMLDAGAVVALGTDGPASGGTLDMFATMRTATLLQKHLTGQPTALPAARVLWMATRGGALALGTPETGSIRRGMKADIICVDTTGVHFEPGLDPAACLVHCARPEDVRLVLVDGRVLKRGERLFSVDERTARVECRRRARRIAGGA